VDEASFRQSPTLHQTWAPRNSQPKIPTRGERNTQKILGAVALDGQFVYRHQTEYFNAQTYPAFIEEEVLPAFYRRGHRVYLIQDNASYHKKPEVYDWFASERKRLEVFCLPPYSPEFNATERIWQYTRRDATHNELRFFACFARKKSGWTESGRRPWRNTWSLEPSRLDPERPMDGDAGGMP